SVQGGYPCTLTVGNCQIPESKAGEAPVPVELRVPVDGNSLNGRPFQIEIPFHITIENESQDIPLRFETIYFEIPNDQDLVPKSSDGEIVRVGNAVDASEEQLHASYTHVADPQVIAPGALVELNVSLIASHLKIRCPLK